MPPEYHLQSFWDSRFKTESCFEWLGDGENTIIPCVQAYLQSRHDAFSVEVPPRVLHIGAGTSSLSERIRDTIRDTYGDRLDEGAIVNVDFSETVVQRSLEREMARAQEGRGRGMRWAHADVLKWSDLARLATIPDGSKDGGGRQALFDIVVDKSTSDAVSCGDDCIFDDPPSCDYHPAIKRQLDSHTRIAGALKVDPVQLLALHLASLVRPGGIWIVLSFSSSRCSLIRTKASEEVHEADSIDPSRYWAVQDMGTVEAPSGNSKPGVYAPAVYHYVYVLCRTDVQIDV